jgi:hypothetical protein
VYSKAPSAGGAAEIEALVVAAVVERSAMLAEAGVDPRSLAPGDEPQAVAVLAQAGLDADDEASDHWLQSNFEQLQAVLAWCSPIALPARRRRACRLRDTGPAAADKGHDRHLTRPA